jgi:hypothetical protein
MPHPLPNNGGLVMDTLPGRVSWLVRSLISRLRKYGAFGFSFPIESDPGSSGLMKVYHPIAYLLTKG